MVSSVLVVCGEAVLDLISDGSPAGYQARPGGSPVNVAVGTARLGIPTALLARLGTGRFGQTLRSHLTGAGVDLALSVNADEPVTLAVVTLDPAGAAAGYDFYADGTADWAWQQAELPDPLPDNARALHVGSISSWRAPAAELIADMVLREYRRGAVLISFDPNLRAALVTDPAGTRAYIEALVPAVHLVKASVEDLRQLYPDEDPDAAALSWAAAGPVLVVVTDGANGARAYRRDRPVVSLPARDISVLDTIGAGDAFTAGLLAALAERDRLHRDGLDHLDESELAAVLTSAGVVAAISCTRTGADPPSRRERDTGLNQGHP